MGLTPTLAQKSEQKNVRCRARALARGRQNAPVRVGHGAKQPTSARSLAVLISSINNLKVEGETHMRIS